MPDWRLVVLLWGLTAEELDPDEYIKFVPEEDIVEDIFTTLEEFNKDEELRDEYDYYDHVLTYWS